MTMEKIHRLDTIGRENSTLKEVIKALYIAIEGKNKEYALELAFEKEFGLKSHSLATIEAELDFLKTQRTMKQMSLLENEKILRTILVFEITRNKYRLN